MFRRTEKPTTTAESLTEHNPDKGPGAKGRPTPSRKEAEAAARERARAVTDKKAASKLLRQRRAEQNAKMREGMRTGDERFLPARDQGPIKKHVRDFIDSRLSIAEFLLPLLVINMVLIYGGAQTAGNAVWSATLILVLVDTIWMVLRLKRSLKVKFPGESYKGTTFYAVMRVIQMRWLRMPKPRVKIGGAPR